LDTSTIAVSCGTVESIRRTETSTVLLRKTLLALAAVALSVGSAAAAFCGLLAASCSSSSAPTAPGGNAEGGTVLLDPNCTAGGLTISFSPMYSAFDGTHTFQIPAVVVGSDQAVTWFADSSMVGMQVDAERSNEVLLTMLGSGATTLHVLSADGKCGSAPLTIDPALESDWEIGRMRYNDGVSVHLAGPPRQGTGSPLEVSGGGGPACTNCHGETATKSAYTNVSHTPEQTGGFSDDELLSIILRGTWPTGKPFDWNIVPYPVWMNFHRWTDITTDQQKGIIVYLRSLTPAPQKGAPNFGAFQNNMDGGMTVVTTPPADGGAPDSSADGASDDGSDDATSGEGGVATDDGSADTSTVDAGAGEASADDAGEAGVDGGSDAPGSEGGDAADDGPGE
jgi:hypothetical protein